MVLDDLDETRPRYEELYGKEHIIVFDKREVYNRIDTGTNDKDMRAIVFARNACFEIAKEMGLKYFLELDDDYTSFDFRYLKGGKLKAKRVTNINMWFNRMIEFLEVSGALTVAFAQGGEYIGGASGEGTVFYKQILRKAMNSFFCKVDRPFEWHGKQNEDVSTYTTLSNKGKLFFTIARIIVIQKPTQSLKGGMTELYKEGGGYNKPFSTVIFQPHRIFLILYQIMSV